MIMNRSAFLKVQLRFNASNVFLLLNDRLITELNPGSKEVKQDFCKKIF